jgi:hypothetical protein
VGKLDRFIAHLNRLLHARDNHDSLILFLAYASHFIATALETQIPRRVQNVAALIGKLISSNIPSRLSSILSAYRLRLLIMAIPTYKSILAERVRALSDILDDWQIITRLWGMFAMWGEAKDFIMSLRSPQTASKDSDENLWDSMAKKAIKATYIIGLLGYYGAENMAWLNKRGVFKWSDKTESKLSMWSLRGWGVFVFAEMAQLLHERSMRMRAGEEQDADEKTAWRNKFVQVVLWGPLTMHWTTEGGLFPEVIASFFSAYVEFITVQGLWKDTA